MWSVFGQEYLLEEIYGLADLAKARGDGQWTSMDPFGFFWRPLGTRNPHGRGVCARGLPSGPTAGQWPTVIIEREQSFQRQHASVGISGG